MQTNKPVPLLSHCPSVLSSEQQQFLSSCTLPWTPLWKATNIINKRSQCYLLLVLAILPYQFNSWSRNKWSDNNQSFKILTTDSGMHGTPLIIPLLSTLWLVLNKLQWTVDVYRLYSINEYLEESTGSTIRSEPRCQWNMAARPFKANSPRNVCNVFQWYWQWQWLWMINSTCKLTFDILKMNICVYWDKRYIVFFYYNNFFLVVVSTAVCAFIYMYQEQACCGRRIHGWVHGTYCSGEIYHWFTNQNPVLPSNGQNMWSTRDLH